MPYFPHVREGYFVSDLNSVLIGYCLIIDRSNSTVEICAMRNLRECQGYADFLRGRNGIESIRIVGETDSDTNIVLSAWVRSGKIPGLK